MSIRITKKAGIYTYIHQEVLLLRLSCKYAQNGFGIVIVPLGQ